jgi:DNA polymerase/3'-5' exonuclease PolX
VSLLKDNCERIEIAGSIRRQKEEVGDIELVAIPKFVETKSNTLFGEPVRQSLLENLLYRMEQQRILVRRSVNGHTGWGERYKRAAFATGNDPNNPWWLAVDLFIVLPPSQFGLQYLVRTGSADFSHRMFARANELGLHSENGAWRRADGSVVECPEEADVFNVLGLDFIPPEDRHE